MVDMHGSIARTHRKEVENALDRQAGVVLLGPRQVGKTTLALDIAEQRDSIYLDMERSSDRAVMSEPDLFLDQHEDRLVIIDEVQNVAELFSSLRGQIDRRRRRGKRYGQFLLLGSAAQTLLKQSSESLAGRVTYHELTPFSLEETGHTNLEQLWIRGGFPESYLAADSTDSLTWRKDFIRTYLERDIPSFGLRIPAETLRRFWTMLAHLQGSLFNASKLATSMAVSAQSVARYLDLLVDLMLVRRLEPWQTNVGKRLIKSPKVFVRDTGVTHALLNIHTDIDLLGHPVVGGSWESFCIENLIQAAPKDSQANFYRTSGGAEIDLVLTLPTGQIWAFEIKRTTSPKVAKGFHIAADDIGADRRVLVYANQHETPAPNDLTAMPLQNAMQLLKNTNSGTL